MPVQCTCYHCGQPITRNRSTLCGLRFCSRRCAGATRRDEGWAIRRLVENYSARAGEPIGDWLRRKYVDESWTYRQLVEALGIKNVQGIQRLLVHFDIAPRQRSEATARQWRDNPKRRVAQRQAIIQAGIRRDPISAEDRITHKRAASTVGSAIRRGDLPPAKAMPCHDCGGRAEHYHHESYDRDKWLDVIPLCAACHDRRHR